MESALNNKLLKRAKHELASTNYDWVFRIYFWAFILGELSGEISQLCEKMDKIPSHYGVHFPRNYFDFKTLGGS